MNYERGLNFAFAYSPYAGDLNQELDPRIGHLAVKVHEWYYDEESDSFVANKRPIGTHPCTREEIGLEGPEKSRFQPYAPGVEVQI